MALANLSTYYTWKNIKSEYRNNKFKTSAPTWNDTFDLSLFFIIKKHETLTENPPVQIYGNRI